MARRFVRTVVLIAVLTVAVLPSPAGAVSTCPTPGAVVSMSGSDYCVFTFTTVGASSWTAPPSVTSVEYLVVGGGGGGGGNKGGGGGGGQVLTGTQTGITPGGSWNVVVGSGGAAGVANNNGGTGGSSSFDVVTANAGLGGHWGSEVGGASGSGLAGGAGSSAVGFSGGGGGGDAAVGASTSTTAGGAGGAGTMWAANGQRYGGGGGGGSWSATGGSGGAGGGGSGTTGTGTNGTPNTGGGGGGAGNNGTGGSGGSGLVVLRYLLTADPSPTSSPTPTRVPARFTISYDHQGGACTPQSNTEDDGTWLQLPTEATCRRPGFELVGWNTAADSSGLGFAPGGWTLVTGDNTLHAIWRVPPVVVEPTPTSVVVTPLNSPALAPAITEHCVITERVLFDYDSTDLTPAGRTLVARVVRALSPRASIVVAGVIRSVGATDADRARALARAHAVETWLRHRGFTGPIAVRSDVRTADQTYRARRVDISTHC